MLWGKKPKQIPTKTAVVNDGAPARLKPYSTANRYAKAKNAIPEIATIPAANPSMPSMKLTALITTNTIKTVNNWPILDGKVMTPLIGSHKI